MAGGMHDGCRGRAWQGVCVAGGICGGWGIHGEGDVHVTHAPLDTTRYGQSMRKRYASYWNAFLVEHLRLNNV